MFKLLLLLTFTSWGSCISPEILSNQFRSDFHPSCILQTEEPTRSKLVFNLYNSQHPNGIILEGNSTEGMNPNSKKVFIVQGFFESVLLSPWPLAMIDVYLKKYDGIDVIHLDWTYYSQIKFMTASCSTKGVGEILGGYIVNMISTGFSENDINIIGFSLGGQLVGFAGNAVYKASNKKVAKITGLDVVGIGFQNNEDDFKLSPDDAQDVIGIHTNSAMNGIKDPFGRVDFYINGGAKQPSCSESSFSTKFDLLELIMKIFCSHLKAPEIKISSLEGNEFVGYKCDSLEIENCMENEQILMGEDVDENASGVYYVISDL